MAHKKDLFLVVILSLAITLFFQYAAIFDPYTINDDVRVETHIYFQTLDQELYPDNPQVEWAFKRNPIGFHGLYLLGTALFSDPIIFGKLLTFFLAIVVGIFSFKIGTLLSKKVGWGLFLLFSVQIWVFQSLSGGMSRAFSYPLILGFIYYLIRKEMIKLGLMLLLQLLFYPIALVISLTVLVISILHTTLMSKKMFSSKKARYQLVILFFFSILSVLLYSLPGDNSLGLVDKETIANDPIYGVQGRIFLYPPQMILSLIIKYSAVTGLLTIFFLPFLLYRKKRQTDFILLYLGIAGFLLYGIAVFFLPQFYYPDRYIRYTLPFVFCYIIASQLPEVMKNVNLGTKKQTISYLMVIIAISLSILPTTTSSLITCNQPALYDFLANTSKDSLIGGHPQDTSCIPTFAKRSVLVSHETIYPLYQSYYALMEDRLNDLFLAYYSDGSDEVANLCEKYKLSYIIVNKDKFFPEETPYWVEYGYYEHRYYIEPFHSRIKSSIGNRTHFYLIAEAPLISINDEISVYQCPK